MAASSGRRHDPADRGVFERQPCRAGDLDDPRSDGGSGPGEIDRAASRHDQPICAKRRSMAARSERRGHDPARLGDRPASHLSPERQRDDDLFLSGRGVPWRRPHRHRRSRLHACHERGAKGEIPDREGRRRAWTWRPVAALRDSVPQEKRQIGDGRVALRQGSRCRQLERDHALLRGLGRRLVRRPPVELRCAPGRGHGERADPSRHGCGGLAEARLHRRRRHRQHGRGDPGVQSLGEVVSHVQLAAIRERHRNEDLRGALRRRRRSCHAHAAPAIIGGAQLQGIARVKHIEA